jgi:uncharacterized oligopeptide transporter (OPT) family protein
MMILIVVGVALLALRFVWRIVKWEVEWTLELGEVMLLLFAGGVLVGMALVGFH